MFKKFHETFFQKKSVKSALDICSTLHTFRMGEEESITILECLKLISNNVAKTMAKKSTYE